MHYKVTTNTELVNNENFFPRENTELGSSEPLVTIFSSTNQYTLILCVETVDSR